MSGGGGYILLLVAGDWNHKYNPADASAAGFANGGSFGYDQGGNNFPGNFSGGAGWYKLIFDFQHGIFTAVKVPNPLPATLYITGDAVASSWTNSPPPAQQFTQLTNSVFQLTVALIPGKAYKFLSSFGNWAPQFGGSSSTGGTLGANWGSGPDPDAIPSPAVAGNYKITVNFLTNTYTVGQ